MMKSPKKRKKARKALASRASFASRCVDAVQDINAWTEGREAPRAAYSSNNYTRRDSLRTFSQLYRSVVRKVKRGIRIWPPHAGIARSSRRRIWS